MDQKQYFKNVILELKQLTKSEVSVLKMLYNFNGEKIGDVSIIAKAMGISKSRVHQLKKHAFHSIILYLESCELKNNFIKHAIKEKFLADFNLEFIEDADKAIMVENLLNQASDAVKKEEKDIETAKELKIIASQQELREKKTLKVQEMDRIIVLCGFLFKELSCERDSYANYGKNLFFKGEHDSRFQKIHELLNEYYTD
jgi:hypothetical protein